MSERGRGSGPDDGDPDREGSQQERAAGGSPPPPVASGPIAPYDPYRSATGDVSRRSPRNVAADAIERPARSSRVPGEDPFLPADDPLSAEAWQLELDDALPSGDDEAVPRELDVEAPPPVRRARRQPLSTRSSRTASARATRASGRRSTVGSTRSRTARPALTIAMPQAVAGSSLVADRTALALIGINAVSLLLMTLLLGIRIGALSSPMVLQLDAAGNPDLWGPPSVLWRLPVMSLFITVMFLVVAWFLHPIDRFAARFALAAAFVAQLIAWAAVFQHLA
jgi:hypothetical protein